MAETKEGTMRVWWIRNVPNEPQHHPVTTLEQAITVLNKLTKTDLENPFVLSNVGGLEVFEDGAWSEFYDGEGQDIAELQEHYNSK